ncbi:PAC2 family protein [Jatrophihabitans lederbergiae]|uniref:PAC2 family protein n=1 Tax=Jatrophihabitans lederbergiae TaxID=3075547 RepID=A0ABU2J7T3_9ACTN|nr:PAC2 family protein [Jatrophihabitans sp. DSM 44399]MDT0260333.1 PAC2 family protein [Jatrophihabitans sp. DSM 44399]
MLDPAGLFDFVDPLPEFDSPVLVQAMDGFVDAGNGSRLARAHLLSTLESELVVTFDVDQVLDYRGRRPEMLFATDHWESYTAPQLAIHALTDTAGTRFLLLSGPEPDTQWERFSAAIKLIVERLGVRLLVGLNAIPMGVPHTRPSTVIAHGSPPSLVAEYSNWLGTVQVPASAGHLMEFRLGETGLDSMGFAVNVPHYLAHLDYPAAAATLLECVAKAGGLELPVSVLDEAAIVTRVDLDAQVASSEQVASVVHALEAQYDEIVAGRSRGLVADGGRLPTADEIGAEFEQYLSQQPDAGEDPPTS